MSKQKAIYLRIAYLTSLLNHLKLSNGCRVARLRRWWIQNSVNDRWMAS